MSHRLSTGAGESVESRELLQARVEERARIGRELHDGLCQQLAGAAYALEVVRQKLAERDAPEAAGIVKVAELVEHALSEARAMAHGTQPAPVGDEGLAPALVRLAAEIEGAFGITCTVVTDGSAAVVDEETAGHLYRIAQEAAGNAIQHGRATAVRIDLTTSGGGVQLMITDDGVGLKDSPDDGRGMGFQTMAYRARAMAGTLEMRPGIWGGTIVICTVPGD